ncbi:MAG: hypothetical protein Ta2A_05040 [Treponemataceae bacterium]|nr:MAG: hypothetical protein Ta2A_05040 [Treponemataceae bacterium]
MMKQSRIRRLFALFFVGAALAFCAVACTKKGAAGARGESITVVATNFPLYDFVREVAGDKVNLSLWAPNDLDAFHEFEPTEQQIKTARDADVFLFVGGRSDAWMNRIAPELQENARGKKVQLFSALSTVIHALAQDPDSPETASADCCASDTIDECCAPGSSVHDEHVWLSLKNARILVQAIAQTLSAADPENATFYAQNADAYCERLKYIDFEFQDIAQEASRKTLIFEDYFPLHYFAADYGFDYYSPFSGCTEQQELTREQLENLVQKIKSTKTPFCFFFELDGNRKPVEAILAQAGVRMALFHSMHMVDRHAFDAGVTYADLMIQNASNLREALCE